MESPRSCSGIPRRRIPNQNLLTRLRRRQLVACYPGTHWHAARQFNECIFPNFTVVNIEKPATFLRKFSPDGRHFIGFSLDQSSLEIFEYQGPCLIAGLVRATRDPIELKQNIFKTAFRLKCVTHVAPEREHLNRECSLFAENGRYVVVASAALVPDNPYPFVHEVNQNNESLPPTARSPLEDYTLHIVDLHTGLLTDSKAFKCDKIFLPHNQGLYLYDDTLAVLSVQHQTIHVFSLVGGTFVAVRRIGRFCYEDDEITWMTSSVDRCAPHKDAMTNALKHRLLTHVWKTEASSSSSRARLFFKQFDYFEQLRIWKMQLLDSRLLLLRYATEDVVLMKHPDPNAQASLFVVYDMETTRVVAMYDNTSEQLYDLFVRFADHFRNAVPSNRPQFTCSSSSNVHAHHSQLRFKKTITKAKYGGPSEAVKRLLAQLPISAQSYSTSPYLDLSLFSYDEKCVSVLERPKACGDFPIK